MNSLKSSFIGRLFTDSGTTIKLPTQPTLTTSVTPAASITVFVPMATSNRPTPGLLKCPNEVLSNIFSNADLTKNDLKAARLTCKELQPTVTREFAQRYFTEPCVILSRYSLEALVEICKHPIFSPHVQSIGFLTTTLALRGMSSRTSQFQRAISIRDQTLTKQALARLNNFTQFAEEQVHLQCSGEFEKLLASAISALGRPITITVTNDIDSIKPIGVSKVPSDQYYNSSYVHDSSSGYNYRDQTGCSEVDFMMEKLLRLVPDAIYQMNLGDRKYFEGLKIRMKQRAHLPQGFDSMGSLKHSQGIYRCLTSLHLETDCSSLRNKESIAAWQHMFTVLPCLQKLTFATSWARGNTIATLLLTNTSRWLETPSKFNLRVLVLQKVACTQETLLFIMESHKETLKEIELSGVTLLGSWKECISWMIDDLHLDNFSFKNACSITHARKTNHGRFIPVDCQVEPTNLTGGKDTRAGLEKLLEHKFIR